MDDLIERARHEVSEDRRIAALARQQHTKDELLKRAQVTEDLIAEVERLRRDLRTECDAAINAEGRARDLERLT
jgi:hypothetical protein